MMMFSTSEETILPKAAPTMTPTAMSTTLPFIANSLKSVPMPMARSSCFLAVVGGYLELFFLAFFAAVLPAAGFFAARGGLLRGRRRPRPWRPSPCLGGLGRLGRRFVVGLAWQASRLSSAWPHVSPGRRLAPPRAPGDRPAASAPSARHHRHAASCAGCACSRPGACGSADPDRQTAWSPRPYRAGARTPGGDSPRNRSCRA